MTADQYKRLIDLLSSNGTLKLTLLGGEPFYRKDLEELVRYAVKRIPYVFITSNGLMINERMEFIRLLDSLTLSVNEAYSSNYETLFFEKVMTAKKLNKNVFIQSNLDKSNIENIDTTLDFAMENNVSISFNPIMDEQGNPVGKNEAAVRKIIESKKKGVPILNSFIHLEHLIDPEKGKPCYAGRLFFYFDSDGSAARCTAFLSADSRYNVFEEGFRFEETEFGNTCRDCGWHCYHDLNSILSFRYEPVMNLLNPHYSKRSLL